MTVDDPRKGHSADRLTVVMSVDADIALQGDPLSRASGGDIIALSDTLKHAVDWRGDGHQTLKTSRASETTPVIAAAATMSGLIRTVRPVWEP